MNEVFHLLGPYYFRRAYRMTYPSFVKLHEALQDGIKVAAARKVAKRVEGREATTRQYVSNPAPRPPNGAIHSSVRLAIALRYFAGGSMYDLSPLYGVSFTDCKNSVWYVVEAINRQPLFAIKYPTDHNEQRRIAHEFSKKSAVGFTGCAGAVDGILIWTHRPYENDAKNADCDAGKFFCGRKHKYGLNCQAVSDVRGRIIDISICFPGSSSDLLAFEASELFQQLTADENFLAEGLCIFGDNAYVNTRFMATPFPNVSSGVYDWYNYYHSQLRIRVECCFGILVQRWGILRSPIPRGVSLTKTVRMVLALAKLHNFCIDEADDVRTPLDDDELRIRMSEGGSVRLDQIQRDIDGAIVAVPRELLDAGRHFEEHPLSLRRRNTNTLPRDAMLQHVRESGFKRPVPQPRRH